MRRQLGTVLLAGMFALLALPAAARAGAGDHCDHDAAHQAAAHAAHHHEDAAVEEVPLGGPVGQQASPPQTRHACKENMTLKCSMTAGCCIKSDGPLSTGLSSRSVADTDLALNDHAAQPPAGRIAYATHSPMTIPQNRAKPDPRPPTA